MTHPIALILGIVAGRVSRERRQRRTHLARALLGALIHADHRTGRIIRAGVHVKDVLHRTHEGRVVLRRYAPHLLTPRLEFVPRLHEDKLFQHLTHRFVRDGLHDLAAFQLIGQQMQGPAGSAIGRFATGDGDQTRLAFAIEHGCPLAAALTPSQGGLQAFLDTAFAHLFYRGAVDLDLLCHLMVALARPVLSLVGHQQDVGMSATVGGHPAHLDQFLQVSSFLGAQADYEKLLHFIPSPCECDSWEGRLLCWKISLKSY